MANSQSTVADSVTQATTAEEAETLAAITRLGEALNDLDVDGVMAVMTEDCVFENTWPAPDGERRVGQAAVRAFWEELVTGTPSLRFDTEETILAGNRATVLWRYNWQEPDGEARHIRGIDLFLVRDGKVAEKLSYVKG